MEVGSRFLLKREAAFAGNRVIIAFANHEARDSVRGWLRRAAEAFDVELLVVQISEDLPGPPEPDDLEACAAVWFAVYGRPWKRFGRPLTQQWRHVSRRATGGSSSSASPTRP